MDEGRKRLLAIVAGILMARHLKTPEDLGNSRPSPRTEISVMRRRISMSFAERETERVNRLRSQLFDVVSYPDLSPLGGGSVVRRRDSGPGWCQNSKIVLAINQHLTSRRQGRFAFRSVLERRDKY